MTLFQLRKSIEVKTGKPLPAYLVAEALGISKQHYSLYEQGRHLPNVIVVRNMMRYFQQWLPELTLEQMVEIIEETRNKKDHAA